MVQRTGGRIAPGDILIRTEEYDDDLLLMFFDLCHPPPHIAESLALVNSLLNIACRTEPGQADTSELTVRDALSERNNA